MEADRGGQWPGCVFVCQVMAKVDGIEAKLGVDKAAAPEKVGRHAGGPNPTDLIYFHREILTRSLEGRFVPLCPFSRNSHSFSLGPVLWRELQFFLPISWVQAYIRGWRQVRGYGVKRMQPIITTVGYGVKRMGSGVTRMQPIMV